MTNKRDMCFATMNLLNLQIPGGVTYNEDKPDIPNDAEGKKLYKARISWFADRIAKLNAHVIAFQELWSHKALEDIFKSPSLADQYDLIARDSPGIGKPQVAAAVRRHKSGKSALVGEFQWIAEFPEKFRLQGVREKHGAEEEIKFSICCFSRPVLHFHVQPEGTRPKPPPIQVYCTHLKSKGGTRLKELVRGSDTILDHHYSLASSAVSHARRVLEAGALRALLDDSMASSGEDELSPTIVMGDLNDATTSITTELITGQPSYKLVRKSRAGEKSDKGLYTAETLQQYRSQRHVYYTYIYKNKLESLDHILASEEFYDHSKKRQWSFREMEVYNDHLNPTQKKQSDTFGGTDHGYVRTFFDWNPISKEIEKLVASINTS